MKVLWMSLLVTIFGMEIESLNTPLTQRNQDALNQDIPNQTFCNQQIPNQIVLNQEIPKQIYLNQAIPNQIFLMERIQRCYHRSKIQICDTAFMTNGFVNQFIINPCKTFHGSRKAMIFSMFGTFLYVNRFFLANVQAFPWMEDHSTFLQGANFLDSYQVFLLAPYCIWTSLTVYPDYPQFAIPAILAGASTYLNVSKYYGEDNGLIAKIFFETLGLPLLQALSRFMNWKNYQTNIKYRAECDEEEMDFMFKAMKEFHPEIQAFNFAQKKEIVLEKLKAALTNGSDDETIKRYVTGGRFGLGIFQSIPPYTEDEIEDEFKSKWSKLGDIFKTEEKLKWMKTEMMYTAQLRRASKMVSQEGIPDLQRTFVRKSREKVFSLLLTSILIWLVFGAGGAYPYNYFVVSGEGENSLGCYKQLSAFQQGKCQLNFLYYQSDRLLIFLNAQSFLYSITLNAGLNMTFLRPWKRYTSDWKNKGPFWLQRIIIGILAQLPFWILGFGVWLVLFNATSMKVYEQFGVDSPIEPGTLIFGLYLFIDFWRMLLSIYGYKVSRSTPVRIYSPRRWVDMLFESSPEIN